MSEIFKLLDVLLHHDICRSRNANILMIDGTIVAKALEDAIQIRRILLLASREPIHCFAYK
jgi:hypothetical protein